MDGILQPVLPLPAVRLISVRYTDATSLLAIAGRSV